MATKSYKVYIIGVLLILACHNQPEQLDLPATTYKDIHTYSDAGRAKVSHLDLDLSVDFNKKILEGKASYTLSCSSRPDEVVFDTYGLEISAVEGSGKALQYELGKKDAIMGSPLKIMLDGSDNVTIHYRTTKDARALQWLEPEQTAQKTSPFLFTQSQAILARTWLPCQDSPGIRFTYTAKIKVPQGFMALMSADNPDSVNPEGIYHFKMDKAIPSYLLALAAGVMSFSPVGARTGIYTEPVMLEKCKYEFAELEKMLQTAESLYGNYEWGRYDILVLPPSFPFGGMENPKLTFATPTIIAGDRSLTSLIAHELAHSWSGNLVTNATWNDFWLNEGFTVYFEQRIMEAMYGRDYSEMLAFLSHRGLKIEMAEIMGINPDDTKLKLELKGRDPDDGMNAIAYDKGYLLLRKIEESIGRPRLDTFLKDYFTSNAFGSMDTESFLKKIEVILSEVEKKTIRMREWIYEPGLPDNCPVITSTRLQKVDSQLNKWIETSSASGIDTSAWSSHEWIHFVNALPAGIGSEKLRELDKNFRFTQSGNCEILCAWFQVAIREKYEVAYPDLEKFLIGVGRRKYLSPLYKVMRENPETAAMADDIYRKARSNYHSVSVSTLDKMLDWNSKAESGKGG